MNIEHKLQLLGLQLPVAPKPGGNYLPVNIRNGIMYIAIQFPKWNGNHLYQGVLGRELSTEDGYKAMQLCALNTLAQIHQLKEPYGVLELNHLEVVYRSVDIWDDAPKVADGASELFINVLGNKGNHTRSIFGVSHLPKNFCVGLTCSFSCHY